MHKTRPAMTAQEFRDGIDRHGISWAELAEATNRTERTIKSYYYGERDVPNVVAIALNVMADNFARANRVLVKDDPWWGDMVRRVTALAKHEITVERAELRRSVNAFCMACEPLGECRTADCQLRSVSPLPLVPRRVTAA